VPTVPDPDWPEFVDVPADALWIEAAIGNIYIKSEWLEANLDKDTEYCFRLIGYLVEGM